MQRHATRHDEQRRLHGADGLFVERHDARAEPVMRVAGSSGRHPRGEGLDFRARAPVTVTFCGQPRHDRAVVADRVEARLARRVMRAGSQRSSLPASGPGRRADGGITPTTVVGTPLTRMRFYADHGRRSP